MRGVSLVVLAGVVGTLAGAQTRPGRVQSATIEGTVISDFDEKPLRRAHVTLRPMEAGLTAIGADGDDKGRFIIRDIASGRYMLIAERDGFLVSSTTVRGSLRMPQIFAIRGSDRVSNLTFRLRPWALLAGHVRFEDAEPAVNVRVDAYREYRNKGRSGYAVVASTRTDDRGEYRMYGLQPGAYFVAAVYERAAPQPGLIDQVRTDGEGREVPVMAYTTTFHPNTVKLSEGVPIRLDYGREISGIDLFLKLVKKVKIRGRVRSGVSGELVTTAAITLQRMDAQNVAGLAVPLRAAFDSSGAFQIRDVTAGPYLLTAEGGDAGERLIGRAILAVAEEDIEQMEVLIVPERGWAGVIRTEGGGRLDQNKPLIAVLEPRSEKGAVINAGVRNLKFDCRVLGDEVYDLYMQNLTDDFYVSAVRVNGSDVMSSGIEGGQATTDRPFEVVLDSRGGRVGGVVAGPDGNAWSGANLMLIPDPPNGRLQAYRDGEADEYGRFMIRGVPPGKYILAAWLDDAPCDIYDPAGLDQCRATGMAVTVAPAAQENVTLSIKARR
jgi:hypothetical protein